MNKINIFKINNKYNILQRYNVKGKGPPWAYEASVLGYDLITSNGELIKCFDSYDVAIEWIKSHD